MRRGPEAQCGRVAFASKIGGLRAPLRPRHEIVADATGHHQISGNDPQLAAISRFAFDDVVGADRES